jgi:2,4-dienoyl-CoA reductase-like NADH-dependent reductase (Old Yellow Enzyme family)
MSKLVEATNLNGMVLKNRFVRSAAAEGMVLVAQIIGRLNSRFDFRKGLLLAIKCV